MSEKFTKWDAADYIHTIDDARFYLEAAVEEDPGDGSLIRAALNDIARAQNMSRLARDIGMTREGLYKALSRRRQPLLRHGDENYPRAWDAASHRGLTARGKKPRYIQAAMHPG